MKMSQLRPASRSRQGRDVDVWSRQQFLERFGRDYAPGNHVTLIGPTQRGKTRISHEMLGQVASPELPAVILAGKPPGRDHLMDEAPDKLGMTLTEQWPPTVGTRVRKRWQRAQDTPRDNGYVLRPHHSLDDLEGDEQNLHDQFDRALRTTYAGKQGTVIVVVDETKLLYDMKLQRRHEAILTRGSPVVAAWSLLQRGRFVSYYAYDMPEHVLFFEDPDQANVRRYAEMVGGIDPSLLVDTMSSLKKRESANRGGTNSEAIYFRRSGSQLIIVEMD